MPSTLRSTVASALRGLASSGQLLPALLDRGRHALAEQIFGHSIAELVDHSAEQGRFRRGLVDEARELLDSGDVL